LSLLGHASFDLLLEFVARFQGQRRPWWVEAGRRVHEPSWKRSGRI